MSESDDVKCTTKRSEWNDRRNSDIIIDNCDKTTEVVPPSSSGNYLFSSTRTSAACDVEKAIGTLNIESSVVPLICGYGQDVVRLATTSIASASLKYGVAPIEYGTNNAIKSMHQKHDVEQSKFLEPIALKRNVHSTPPLRHGSELNTWREKDDECNDCDSDEEPRGLETWNHARSRSTPLLTSKNSAFGSVNRTKSQSIELKQIDDESSIIFGTVPKDNETSVLKVPSTVAASLTTTKHLCSNDQCEMTSIEVMQVPTRAPVPVPSNSTVKTKMKSRATKLFKDFRNLRMSSGGKYRPRNVRDAVERSSFIPFLASESGSFHASISSSSGCSTNATIASVCNSSNGHSNSTPLSTVSETDLEVASANRSQRHQVYTNVLSVEEKKCDDSFAATFPAGRGRRLDGASVRADRFFALQKPHERNLPPFCRDSSCNTSSTGTGSSTNEPPKIVSLDRNKISDLTSLRSIERELRDSSPLLTTHGGPPLSHSPIRSETPPRHIVGITSTGIQPIASSSEYHYNLTASMSRTPSPLHGQVARTCMENSIEILKVEPKGSTAPLILDKAEA